MRAAYRGTIGTTRKVFLLIVGVAFSIIALDERNWVVSDSFFALLLVWAIPVYGYYIMEKRTYIQFENGVLYQRQVGSKKRPLLVVKIARASVEKLAMGYPVSIQPSIAFSTSENNRALVIPVSYYPQSELARLLRDLKSENPNIEYDAEAYAIMQERSKYYPTSGA